MLTISDSIFEKDGHCWYFQPNGTRQRALIKSCETCNTEFATYPSGKTRFCSQECWRRSCLRCGGIFNPRTKRTIYCSHACQRGVGKCENCGRDYIYSHHGVKRFCSMPCHNDFMCPFGTIRPRGDGYMMIKVSSEVLGIRTSYGKNRKGWMLLHRYVMQEKLGRPILSSENIHHLNGQRDDNRPENLELWNKPQPVGIRASDYHCPGCNCFNTLSGVFTI